MSRSQRFVFSKKTILIASIGAVVISSGVITSALMYQNDNTQKSGDTVAKNVDEPQFGTVLPNGKTADNLGGWTRISPPENDPVYAYTDSINKIPITVSQQPLPTSFKTNQEAQVAELAKKFNATAAINAGKTKAYVGTSAKGPQSVIFAKNNLLILIKSEQKIEDSAWAEYINSLR